MAFVHPTLPRRGIPMPSIPAKLGRAVQRFRNHSSTTSGNTAEPPQSPPSTSKSVCPHCWRSYTKRKECTRHATSHVLSYACPATPCSYTNTRKERFKKHYKDYHTTHADLCKRICAVVDSAATVTGVWAAFGCGICQSVFEVTIDHSVPEHVALRKTHDKYINHCLSHFKDGHTRETWSETQQIMSLVQQSNVLTHWAKMHAEREEIYGRFELSWSGARTHDFISMLQQGNVFLGDQNDVNALSLSTLIDAGIYCNGAKAKNPFHLALPHEVVESRGGSAWAMPLLNGFGVPDDAPAEIMSSPIDWSQVAIQGSSAFGNTLDGITMVEGSVLTPSTTFASGDGAASCSAPSMRTDQMQFSDHGGSPGFGGLDNELQLEQTAVLAGFHHSLAPQVHHVESAEIMTPAHVEHTTATGQASYKADDHFSKQSSSMYPGHSAAVNGAAKASHAQLFKDPVKPDRKKRPVSWKKQIKRVSREITSAIFSNLHAADESISEHPPMGRI